MSKMFYKGRLDAREEYGKAGYNPDKTTKHGSEQHPITITVNSAERESEIKALLQEHELFANITVDADAEENTSALDVLLKKPATVINEKTPNRNDPCSCGSGKKYKKCCG